MKDRQLYPQQQILIPNIATISSFKLLVRSIVTIGVCSGFTFPASAQITYEDGKPVPKAGGTDYIITGGTPSASGTNVFHSFGTFNLTSQESANFVPSSSAVQNIFGRINGGLPSSIDGKIFVNGGQTTSTVNLYLMNPAGIIFGKNASLDINGAFTATTARAIGFGNGNWFNAVGTNNYPALTGTPEGFAFTNTPGTIFNASSLMNAEIGKSITLVGGTVISTGDIKTNGGTISIATVKGGQYVQIKSEGSILSLNLPIDLPDNAKNIDAMSTAFTPPTLPELLTGSDKKVTPIATGVTVDANGVVKLVSENKAIQNRPISTGDIVTKNIETGSSNNFIPGGSVTLTTQVGDIIVGSIVTSNTSTSRDNQGYGGNLTVNAAGLFRAIGKTTNQRNGRTSSIDTSEFGIIKITHGGNSFAIDLGENFPDGVSGTSGSIFSTLNTNGTANVVFRDGVFTALPQGTGFDGGPVLTGNVNQFQVKSVPSNGGSVNPSGTTSTNPSGTTSTNPSGTTPTNPSGTTPTNGQTETTAGSKTDAPTGEKTGTQVANQPSNPDPQAANQKSKQDCTPSSSAVSGNSTTDPNRAAGNASAPSADPCELVTGSGSTVLQILNNKN